MTETYEDFFLRVTGNRLLPYQARYGSNPFSPTLLIVPTGLGKTQAVLLPWLYARASKNEAAPTRLIIVLPRQNLTAQTADTARRMTKAAGLEGRVQVLELMASSADNDAMLGPNDPAIIVSTQDLMSCHCILASAPVAAMPPKFKCGRYPHPIGAELLFRVLFFVSVILLFAFPPSRRYSAQMQLWRFAGAMNWSLVAPAAAGLSLTWWARIHLGRLWSDRVVKKAGHHVVDTGPYRLVRHPIYAGLIFAVLATAIEKGTSFALLGLAILTTAFYIKARREEHFLRAELGENAYDDYARKTPMLLPFV